MIIVKDCDDLLILETENFASISIYIFKVN